MRAYLQVADEVGCDYIEVGHGNGLGASSMQLGESLVPELRMIGLAKSLLKKTKVSVHAMPGFATISKNLSPAIEHGVDLFRIGTHCTEADLSARHIEYIRKSGSSVWGILMMCHMASAKTLLEEAEKMISYGADAIVLMDSAGTLTPSDVREKISTLVAGLNAPVGFHAHENLGLSVINSITALEAGASILDATACGLGAGAGNTPLGVLIAALHRTGYGPRLKVDLYKALRSGAIAGEIFRDHIPSNSETTIISGLNGVFSGFAKPVLRIANELNVDPKQIFSELGARKIIGGQEDLILEIAHDLKKRSQS